MKLFVAGRKNTFPYLQENKTDKPLIWVHAASLGEYEQAVPVLKAFRQNYPDYQILVSFFSPSGYEVKKNSAIADLVCYLPIDTANNAKKFMSIVQPTIAFFIKYEVWPNYIQQLEKLQIPALLISGLFRKDQIYFKPYGKFMRQVLRRFNYIFVQDKASLQLLQQYSFEKIAISGDTRFDRVTAQLTMDNKLAFAEEFVAGKLCVVCGSTWPEDEEYLVPFINNSSSDAKFIIAPHQIKTNKIKSLQQTLSPKTILYSDIGGKDLSDYKVLIVDTIGLLSKLYFYADVSYVGGAMGKTGLHNVLEPATFGVPIVIGNNFKKFPEAYALQNTGALIAVKNQEEVNASLNQLLSNQNFREKTGKKAQAFIKERTGATQTIIDYIKEQHLL